jgi:hypothetical protein
VKTAVVARLLQVMTQRVRVVGLAIVLASCTSPYRETLGSAGRSPRRQTTPTNAGPGVPGPQPTSVPTTTVPVTGNGPTAIASRFTMAYFTAAPGDAPGDRRQRCRSLDTDTVDQLLAAPNWNGAANHPEAGQTVTATIDTLNPVDTPAQGIGYELTVTVTASLAGRVLSRDQVGVQIWVVSPAAGPGESARYQ